MEKGGDCGAVDAEMSVTVHSLSGLIYQHQVSKIDKHADALPSDKNRISAVDSIGQYNEAAEQTHIPKCYRHLAFGFSFRRNPLNDPTRKK